MVKGINNNSKCLYEVYTKEEVDNILANINENIDSGGNTVKEIQDGNIVENLQTIETNANDLISTSGMKMYYSTTEEMPTSDGGYLLHFGDGTTASQIYIDSATNNVYIRTGNEGQWNNWSFFNKNISITSGTGNPSGGSDGDIYFKYS